MNEILFSNQTLLGTLVIIFFLFVDVGILLIWLRTKCKNIKECFAKLKKWISSNTLT